MQLKRWMVWLLLAVVVLSSVGCNRSSHASGNADKRPTSLMTADEVFQKLDGGYHKYFEPREGGYGQLVPYIGKVEEDVVTETGETTYFTWWGLCTADGHAVTDAVYTAIERYELDDGGVFELREQDVAAMVAGEEDYADHGWVIAEDGSWMIDSGDNAYLYGTENGRLVVASHDDPVWYRIYDYDGNVVTQIEARRGEQLSLQPFSGGYAYVEKWSDQYGETVGYYINRKGKRVFTNDFLSGDSFRDGKAVVCLMNRQYGILNENGTWFVQPEYGQITRWDNYFVLYDGQDCILIDTNGHEWRRFPNTKHVSLVVGKRVLYSTDSDEHLRYVDSGLQVINTQTRKVLTVYDAYGETFLTTHDKENHRLYLLDYNGGIINEVPDFGHIGGYDDNYLYVYSHSDPAELRLIKLSDGTQRLSTYGYAFETPRDGWYCIDDAKGNYTLQDMSGSDRIRFPNTNLIVQEFGGKLYYQTYNMDVLVLMDETMKPIIKLKNE